MKPAFLSDIADGDQRCERPTFSDDGRSRRATTVTTPAGDGVANFTGNRRIVDLFSRYAVLDKGSVTKRFTDAIYELDRRTTASLFRGLFTADGTVANYGVQSRSTFRSTSCSLALLKQVQHLLLSFGVKSKLYTNRRVELVSNCPERQRRTC